MTRIPRQDVLDHVRQLVAAAQLSRRGEPPAEVTDTLTLDEALDIAVFSQPSAKPTEIYSDIARLLAESPGFRLFEDLISREEIALGYGEPFVHSLALYLQAHVHGAWDEGVRRSMAGLLHQPVLLNAFGRTGSWYAARRFLAASRMLSMYRPATRGQGEALALVRLHILDKAREHCPASEEKLAGRIERRMREALSSTPSIAEVRYSREVGGYVTADLRLEPEAFLPMESPAASQTISFSGDGDQLVAVNGPFDAFQPSLSFFSFPLNSRPAGFRA